MPRTCGIMQVLAAIVLLLFVGVIPITDAVARGPGTLVVEAAHTGLHAERDEHWQATGRDNQDASDHDHSKAVIIEIGVATLTQLEVVIEDDTLPLMTRVIRDGPHRPLAYLH